jgi:hypothetical protein
MVAMLKPAVQVQAQFGPSKLSAVSCVECYDTGLAGGSAWTAGTRCTACRGLSPISRLLSRFKTRTT